MPEQMILTVSIFLAAGGFIAALGLLLIKGGTSKEAAATSPSNDRFTLEWSADGDNEKSRLSRFLMPKEEHERKRLEDRLIQAGLYRRNSVLFYLATKAVGLLLPVLLGFGLASTGMMTTKQGLTGGLIVGIVGTLAPGFWLEHQKRQRQTTVRRALPDALDILVVCVEAGLSFTAALQRVADELRTAYPLLAAELGIAQREIQMGCTTGEALRRLSNRFDVEELRSLASLIQQTEKFGASIVKALRVHSESLRTRREQSAEELAQKASVKLLFPTVFFIFPALFVVILGPATNDIMRTLQQMKQVKKPIKTAYYQPIDRVPSYAFPIESQA